MYKKVKIKTFLDKKFGSKKYISYLCHCKQETITIKQKDTIMKKQIKDLKIGEYFTLKDYSDNDVPERAVWVRGEYDKSSKTYSCYKFSDTNKEHFFKGVKEVFTEFYF